MSGNDPTIRGVPNMYGLYYFKFDGFDNRWKCLHSPESKEDLFSSADDAEIYAKRGGQSEVMIEEGPGTYRIDVREVFEDPELGVDYCGTLAEITFVVELQLRRYG